MSTEPPTERRPLPEVICRGLHAYEWAPTSGTHSPVPRRTPCPDCELSAAPVVEWLAGEVTGGALEAAS